MVNSLKYAYKKEVDFLIEKDAEKIYKSLESFMLVKVNENE